MDMRYAKITTLASSQFGAVSTPQLNACGVDRRTRSRWAAQGLLEQLGPRSYAIVGSSPSWHRSVWAAMADVDGVGHVAGRSAARLWGLDGFSGDDVEVLVGRAHRSICTPHRVSSTSLPVPAADTGTVDGIRCLSAERLILDAPLFVFSRGEVERAVDSAIRLRLVSEQRLRTKVVERHRRGINHGLTLLDALVDTGGESRLERWFLGIVRRAGLPRPELQKTWRADSRFVARVDAFFPGGLVVEVAGHGTHSSRADRQRDEQRRTELMLMGLRVITFTYDDIKGRPQWVADRLTEALALHAA
jgi:hypothetical protein